MRDARYDIAEAKFSGIESSIKDLSKDEMQEKGEQIFMYLFTILMKMNEEDGVLFAFSAMQSLTSVATGGSVDDNQKETIVNLFAADILKDIINGSEGAFWEEPGEEAVGFVKMLLGVDSDLATQMALFMLCEAYSIGGDIKNIERIKDVYLEGTFDNVMSDLLNSGLVHMADDEE